MLGMDAVVFAIKLVYLNNWKLLLNNLKKYANIEMKESIAYTFEEF